MIQKVSIFLLNKGLAETSRLFFEPGTDGIAPIGNRCPTLMELEDWNENNLGVPITMFPL